MQWIDIEDIAYELYNKHKDFDVHNVTFTKLMTMIMQLEGFKGESGKCNERILEAVQSEWLSLIRSD